MQMPESILNIKNENLAFAKINLRFRHHIYFKIHSANYLGVSDA